MTDFNNNTQNNSQNNSTPAEPVQPNTETASSAQQTNPQTNSQPNPQEYQQNSQQTYQQSYQQSYQPPNYYSQQPYQPQPPVQNYTSPVYANPQTYGQKSRIAASLLAFLFGTFGVHNFYMGYTGKGVAQVLLSTLGSVITCGVSAVAVMIWSIIEGISLMKGDCTVDGHGIPFID